jgi:hypothetical protein
MFGFFLIIMVMFFKNHDRKKGGLVTLKNKLLRQKAAAKRFDYFVKII